MAYFRCGSTPGGSSGAGNATAGDILSGKTAVVQDILVTGNMANNGAVSQTLNAGGSYTVPAGFHNGSGTVTANSLASQTSGTAAAGDILDGKTAWVNGTQITGTGTIIPGTVTETKTIINRQLASSTDFGNGTAAQITLSIPITATLTTNGQIEITASATGTLSTWYYSSGSWIYKVSKTFTVN